jgi:pyruvate formate lyase activating enzyme
MGKAVEKVLKADIWKIDRFAIHDGPGIRTNIYFKGCPLHCLWCSNPEGQHKGNELGFQNAKCTGCGLCWESCPQRAIKPRNGIPALDRAKCNLCEQCCLVCPTGALWIYGRFYTLSQIMDVIERDRYIYRRSGGGITCTGGEPLLQARFLQHLLAKCREVGIHTTLETSGCARKSEFQKTLNNLDWLFFDLKTIDNAKHKKFTGKDNALILDNLRLASSLLGQMGRVLVIRQVVVPGLNDESNIRALAELAGQLPHVNMIELLPYHNYGMHKYMYLGREYLLQEIVPPSEEKLKEYKEIIESSGIDCKIGGL